MTTNELKSWIEQSLIDLTIATTVRGDVVEVACSRPFEAANRLRRLDGYDIQVYGSSPGKWLEQSAYVRPCKSLTGCVDGSEAMLRMTNGQW